MRGYVRIPPLDTSVTLGYRCAMQAMKKLEAAGFSRADIARELGVQRQAVGHWARDRNSPSGSLTAALIELGKRRGVSFMAEDFIPEAHAA